MLNTFRNVTFIKAMMWIVAAAFVGLIVLEWGADISGRRVGPAGDTVGVINGREISHKQFDTILRNAYLRAKAENAIDPELGPLVRQTWDQLVTEVLIVQQMQAHNITVSDREVDFVNRTQPIAEVQNIPDFQTDGKFDPAKYARFLDDPGTYSNPQVKQFVLSAESAVRRALRFQKLQELVTSAVKVTSAEVREAYVNQYEKVRVAYAGVETSAFPDSLALVSESEVRAYYDAHKDEYHQDAAVQASFVSFSKTPSARDSAETEAEIRRLLAQIRAGDDFGQLARNNSDDPGSAQKDGDLGFFGRGQMVKAFEDTAFSLDSGEISEPFRTQFGWHIVKVEDRKGAADSLRVHARHILLQTRARRNTLDSLRLQANVFLEHAEEFGFEGAVTEVDLVPQDTGFITAGGFFPLLRNRTSGLVNGFLAASPGEISPLYETDQGIYIFVLRAKRAAGPQPLDEVRGQIFVKLKGQKKVGLAAQWAAPVLDGVRGGSSLKEAAKAHGLRVVEPKPFSRNDFLPGIGGRNAFIGAAFRLQSGEMSDVVTTEGGAYILQVLERQPIDDSAFQAERQALTQRLLSQKRSQTVAIWLNNLKTDAEIVDSRHYFYTDF